MNYPQKYHFTQCKFGPGPAGKNKSGPGIKNWKNRDRDREWKKPGIPGPGPDVCYPSLELAIISWIGHHQS